MNYRFVFNQLGVLLTILSLVLLGVELTFLTLAWADEITINTTAVVTLLLTAAGGVGVSVLIRGATRQCTQTLGRRDALLLVALSWLFGAAYAALPYFIWAQSTRTLDALHPFNNYISCYFEAMSGLTTTGATVLSDIEALPHSLLLWRAFTHWLGGLGIVVLFVAVLPSLGVGGKRLYKLEAPGPTKAGVRPSIRETARILWYIYLGLTVIQTAALMIAGMSVFDAISHTFATLATGGFSTRNASTGAFTGPWFALIFIFFMILAGMNFSLFDHLLHGRFKAVFHDTELRIYLSLLAGASLVIVLALLISPRDIVMTDGSVIASNFSNSLREGVTTAVAIQTTKGFCTSDFDRWPFIAKAVLVTLMFIGGCAGSTAGGIKVIRVWVALRIMAAEIEHAFRPQVVRPIRLGGSVIDPAVRASTIAFVLGTILIFATGSIGIMMLEHGFGDDGCAYTTAASASLATLCTIGPGLDAVGATRNYGWMCSGSKVLLSLLMVMGRLEIFAILALVTPRFWREV
ncbi:MAG: TrkH family potassium uptake protein [Phycisphaerales bacterium]